METQAPITQPIETPPTTPTATPIETPAPAPDSARGIGSDLRDFRLVEYFTFALIISASVYSIFYHRQMLNKHIT